MSDSPRDNLISKIKSKGHWEINIRPVVYKKDRLAQNRLKDIVRSKRVDLRGWDYPHIEERENGPYPIQTGIEKITDWSYHIEFWRMTTSGNFYHLVALKEDWLGNIEYRNIWAQGDELRNKKWLGVTNNLYRLTEIFEFAKRLALANIYDGEMIIDIKLHDIENRMLVIESYDRMPLAFPRIARVPKWSAPKDRYIVSDVIENSAEIAFQAYLNLVYLFGWENPPVEILKNDQEKFLHGKA